MNNIRPISLQNCLGKLFSKVLARRLGHIFLTHPILNPSQRGFLPGGTTIKCIDELLDAWSWSRDRKAALFTLFYDIQQAYDSVQLTALIRSLTRIRLPASFIALIADSLTGLSSAILTSYGLTQSFPVKRSVRQGDPLAPLLFIILMDALHDGLDTNPFTGKQHGCTLTFPHNNIYLPSLGYADDSTVICNTLEDLKVQNEWVAFFMEFNHLRLNPKKCDLVGRMADGSSVSKQSIQDANIKIDGHVPTPLSHDYAIRYLGAHFSFDGSWKEQQNLTRNMIYKFTTAVDKFKVSISQAVKMFNVFLLPRMELALHYVHGPGTSAWIHMCDKLLIAAIRHRASSPVKLSHSAIALATHTLLPSWLEVSIKVSELFLRMNSKDERWGALGRIMLREQCGSQINAAVTPGSRRSSTRSDSLLKRTAHLIVKSLHGEALLDKEDNLRSPTDSSRHTHVFDTTPYERTPNPDQCSSRNTTTRKLGFHYPLEIIQDCWRGYGTLLPTPSTVHVYTDGSFAPYPHSTSSWAVLIESEWLTLAHVREEIPKSSQYFRPSDIVGAPLFGAPINCTQGIYPAELQAIARTLAMLPLSYNIHIHSDSKAAIAGIHSYSHELNERHRMRMQGRPLLALIHHLISIRKQVGGNASFSHVKSHTSKYDIRSVGNSVVDYQAELCRKDPDKQLPLNVKELPLESFEQYFKIYTKVNDQRLMIIDDIRLHSKNWQKIEALNHWMTHYKHNQGALASTGMMDLGKCIMKFGNIHEQNAFIHLATNTLHFYHQSVRDKDNPRKLIHSTQQVLCHHRQCTTAASNQPVGMDLLHFAICPHSLASSSRDQLKEKLITSCLNSQCKPAWINANRRLEFPALLLRLFPPTAEISTADDKNRHLARCMAGAFTCSEANAAAKLLGFPLPQKISKQQLSPMDAVRLLSLNHLFQTFTSWKP